MNSVENITTTGTPTPVAAMIGSRRKSVEGDEENGSSRMVLPSPCREPLRPLQRNNNSKDCLFDLPRSPPVITKPTSINTRQRSDSSNTDKTPLKTPSTKTKRKTSQSPFTGAKTPNAGKILSPLPLQQRKLQTAKKQKVKIDMDEFLSQAPHIETPANEINIEENTGFFARNGEDDEITELNDNLFDLKISKTFDEDESSDVNDNDSLGWAYTLDDFKFVRKLGTGGTADVYEVLETGTCALYALKVQPATEDAMCEVDLHIPLKHENICQMIDYFYSDKRPFDDFDPLAIDHSQGKNQDQSITKYLCTILEVCNRGDIHDLIDEYITVPEDIAAKVTFDAIKALQYLHSMGTIHCDIKPANWLIDGWDNDTVIKLADFGMAVNKDAKEIVGGSPVYMAPEHLLAWRNLTNNFDHRTDIYSLGVVLYEMLAGYLPYEVLEPDRMQGQKNTKTEDVDGSIAKELSGLTVEDPDKIFDEENCMETPDGFPVLDLRKLNCSTSDAPFYIPPPIFVEEISKEAQDLILRLMEPSISKRVTLEEARDHEWFRKFSL